MSPAEQAQQPLDGWSMGLTTPSELGSFSNGSSFNETPTTSDTFSLDASAASVSNLEHIADPNNPVLPFARINIAARRASYALTLESIVQRGIALPMNEEIVQPHQLDLQRFADRDFSMGFFIPGTSSLSILTISGLLLNKRRRT